MPLFVSLYNSYHAYHVILLLMIEPSLAFHKISSEIDEWTGISKHSASVEFTMFVSP